MILQVLLPIMMLLASLLSCIPRYHIKLNQFTGLQVKKLALDDLLTIVKKGFEIQIIISPLSEIGKYSTTLGVVVALSLNVACYY